MTPYYEHAGITIYHGDCREVLPHVTADVLVTDPPYGIGYIPNHSGGTNCDWFDEKITGDESTAVRDALLATLPPAMPAIVFGTWKAPRPKDTRAVLIWDKGPAAGAGNLSFPWKPTHEEIYILGEGFAGHRGESVLRHVMVTWATMGREPRQHPTQKPVALLHSLMAKCPPGVVLDPFMGSGTTLVAAKNLGRRAIGIETEERYCEIAAKRLAQEVLFGAEAVR